MQSLIGKRILRDSVLFKRSSHYIWIALVTAGTGVYS